MFLPHKAVQLLFACGLAAALLLAQALGTVHGVAHHKAADRAHSHAHVHAHAHGGEHADEAAHQQSVLASVFAVHDGANDCRLFDQASQDGMLALLLALALPVVLPPFEVAIFQGEALARSVALFDARGPPLTV
ncbi:MAG: hypothetical protein ACK5A0_04085 [Polaromonas sp.]|jgi:hypothetical protein